MPEERLVSGTPELVGFLVMSNRLAATGDPLVLGPVLEQGLAAL